MQDAYALNGQKTRHRRKEKYLDRKDRTMSYKFTYRNVRDITLKQTFLTKKKRKTSKLPGQLRNLMVNLKCNEIFSQVKPGFPFSPMNNQGWETREI